MSVFFSRFMGNESQRGTNKSHENRFAKRFTRFVCSALRFISHEPRKRHSFLKTTDLTAVKDHVIKYSETAFSYSHVNYVWSIKNSSEVIEKLRLRNFQGYQVSSFDFSAIYTSLPHDLIKAKVLSLVKWCFKRE